MQVLSNLLSLQASIRSLISMSLTNALNLLNSSAVSASVRLSASISAVSVYAIYICF